MAENIDNILNQFIKYAVEQIDIEEMYLYGSYAKGSQKEDSDIDIAVIVNSIDGNFLDIYSKLYSIVTDIDYRLEPILLVKTHDKPDFIGHVKSYGKLLYKSN